MEASLNLTPEELRFTLSLSNCERPDFNLSVPQHHLSQTNNTPKMILRKLSLLAALLPFALADVQFTSPKAGQSISGLTLEIEWKDSGDVPKIDDLATYQMFLCAGGNDEGEYV